MDDRKEQEVSRSERDQPRAPEAVYTIGHSTRPIGAFLELLLRHGIELVADVRRFPGSRRHPHFGSAALAEALGASGMRYVHVPELGGRRGTSAHSSNTGWRNASFRGYADYMQTPEFDEALARLVSMTMNGRTVLMCAESLPWRCHRSLIADALVARGVPVFHIMDAGLRPHALPPFARVRNGGVTYPAAEGSSSAPGLFDE